MAISRTEPIYVGPIVKSIPRKIHPIYVGPSLQGRNPRPGVPGDYVEFVALYASRIKLQVSGFSGIDRDEVDDITQSVIMQFIAGDYLNIYSADRQSHYAEARYQQQQLLYESGEIDLPPIRCTGKFSSFVFEFVKRRLMGIRDKTNRRVSIMRSLDSFFEVEREGDEQEASLLVFVGQVEAEFQNVELRQLLQRAYAHLCSITVPTSTRDFPQLFLQAVVDAFDRSEGFDREIYARNRGITVSAVSMQVREMRLYLEQFGLYRMIKELIAKRDKQSRYAAY